jgi:hypothetical protein
MGWFMKDDQFMVQVLNSLTNEYKLQMLLLEKRIGSKHNPLTIDELKEELSLRYEILSMKIESAKINNLGKEMLYWLPNSKVNVKIAVKLVTRQLNANQSRWENKEMELFVITVRSRVMWSPIVLSWWERSSLKRMEMVTQNYVAGNMTEIVLSSIESGKKVTMRFGSEIAMHRAITAMTIRVCTSTKLF